MISVRLDPPLETIIRVARHFAVDSEEDIEWMIEFMGAEHDWWVDSVYMDQDWIDAEVSTWDLLTRLPGDDPNRLPVDHPRPRFEALTP